MANTSPVESFSNRAVGVSKYLRSIRDLEKNHSIPGKGFYSSKLAIQSSRASSFIMIYNCVEFGLREATKEVRLQIANGGHQFEELGDYWRIDLIKQRHSKRLQSGGNFDDFLRMIALEDRSKLRWPEGVDRVPFSGNIDQMKVMRFVRDLGVKWSPPPTSLGGIDLDLIKRMRNDLAHGRETFEAVGANYSAEDIIEKFTRTRKFMISALKAIKRHEKRGLYLI